MNPFQNVREPLDVEIFIGRVLKGIKNYLKQRNAKVWLKILEDNLKPYYDFLNSIPDLDSIDPFYREISYIIAPDLQEKLRGLRVGLKIIKTLIKQTKRKLKKGRKASNLSIARDCIGRTFSILRRRRKEIEMLRDYVNKLRNLPSINSELPIIIVSGPPNVGKSLLVRTISSGKPEVGNFPFTTKRISLGHIDCGMLKVQVMDTPGLLDRPAEERNAIEKQAISALRSLKGVNLFLLDISKGRVYPIEDQLNVLRDVVKMGIRPIVALNKIDNADEDALLKSEDEVKKIGLKSFRVSIIKGEGIRELMMELLKDVKGCEKLIRLEGIWIS